MTTVLRVPAMLVAAVLSFTPAVTAQDLSPEVQIDLAMAALERAILAEDHGDIVDRIGALRALDPTLAGGELLYFEATALAGQGKIEEAEQALNRFLTEVGQQSANYEDALALMLDLPELRKAQAKADRLAAAERRAEKQRQREENARREEEAARAAEAALKLSKAELRHIRWILHQEYGKRLLPPVDTESLSDTERDWLAKYLRKAGIPFSGYLDARIAAHFRSKSFQPHSLLDSHRPPQRKEVFGDWVLLVEANAGECELRTSATGATPNSIYAAPLMRLSIYRDHSNSDVTIWAVTPYLFAADRPITAKAAGRRIPLVASKGLLFPEFVRRNGKIYFWEGHKSFIRALRDADRMEITGFNLYTAKNETVFYSATGFTNAYMRMLKLCNAPNLHSWIQ